MKTLNASLLVAAAAVSGLVGCGKAAEQIKNEADKVATRAKLTGSFAAECEGSGPFDLGSKRTKYSFDVESHKTIQLFSDGQCRDKVGEIKYTGNVTVGNPSAVEESNLLDLEFNKVTLKIDKQEVVDTLNKAWIPSCGINNLEVGKEVEVTAQTKVENKENKNVVQEAVESIKKSFTCPIEQPKPVYDIGKVVDGKLQLGKVTAGHDKSTKDARPVELDKDPKSVLAKE